MGTMVMSYSSTISGVRSHVVSVTILIMISPPLSLRVGDLQRVTAHYLHPSSFQILPQGGEGAVIEGLDRPLGTPDHLAYLLVAEFRGVLEHQPLLPILR